MEFLLLCSLLSISCVLLLILVELKKFMKHMERVVELLTVINDTVTCQKTLLHIMTDPYITLAEDELEEVRRGHSSQRRPWRTS